MNTRTPIGTWIGVASVAAIGCVPIVGQPVQVDDPLFLGVAKQILETPADPFGGKPPWHDGDWFRENANPPLWPYLLAATAALFGWNETAFQGLQCLANVALTFGVFALARRVCERPLFWTAACLLSPFLLPGRNLMADTLMLALWCWSFEFFLQYMGDGKCRMAVPAGLLAAAALLTKYTAGLLPVVYLILGLKWRNLRPAAWAIPAIVFALWCWHNQHFYGRTHFFASLTGGGVGVPIVERLQVFLRVVGAVALWGPAFLFAAWSFGGRTRRLFVLLTFPVVALVVAADLYDVIVRLQLANVLLGNARVAQFAAFTALGAVLLSSLPLLPMNFDAGPAGKAKFAVAVWLAAAAAFNLFATSPVAFGAVRHLVVVLVPLLLLGGGAFDAGSAGRFAVRLFGWLTLFLAAGLGGVLAHGDRLSASAGADAARTASSSTREFRVAWITGDPALRYQAEKFGVRWKRPEEVSDVAVGDDLVLLYSRVLALQQHPLFSQQSRLVERFHLESWNPLRTQGESASFYGANAMTRPWAVEAKMLGPRGGYWYDEILIYRRARRP